MDFKKAEEPSNNSPAFTGDILFHNRLDAILKSCHMNKIRINTINEYMSSLDSFLSEIYYWLKNDEDGDNVGQIIINDLKSCKSAYAEYLRQSQKIKNPTVNVYKIKEKLDEIFFKLNFQAHSNKLILRRKDNQDAAFMDL